MAGAGHRAVRAFRALRAPRAPRAPRRAGALAAALLLHLAVAAVASREWAIGSRPAEAPRLQGPTLAEPAALQVQLLTPSPSLARLPHAEPAPASTPGQADAAQADAVDTVDATTAQRAGTDATGEIAAVPSLLRQGRPWFPYLSERDLGTGYFQQAFLLRLGPAGQVLQAQALPSEAPPSFGADVLGSFQTAVVGSADSLGSGWVCLKLLYSGADRSLRTTLEAHTPWGACGAANLPAAALAPGAPAAPETPGAPMPLR